MIRALAHAIHNYCLNLLDKVVDKTRAERNERARKRGLEEGIEIQVGKRDSLRESAEKIKVQDTSIKELDKTNQGAGSTIQGAELANQTTCRFTCTRGSTFIACRSPQTTIDRARRTPARTASGAAYWAINLPREHGLLCRHCWPREHDCIAGRGCWRGLCGRDWKIGHCR